MSDIITKSDQPINTLLWSREEEELLKDWALIANSFRWLHERSAMKFKKLNNKIALPVIIISTLTGTANFGLSTLVSKDSGDQTWAQIAIGGANIFCGVLTTIQTYFKYAENTEAHLNAAKNWSRFHRIISIELALEPTKRKNPNKFLKYCIEQYNDLKEHSPVIPIEIANDFKSTFKRQKINLPDIYDNISNTVTYGDYLIKRVKNNFQNFNDYMTNNSDKSDNKSIRSISSSVNDLIDIRVDGEKVNADDLFNSKITTLAKNKLIEKHFEKPKTTKDIVIEKPEQLPNFEIKIENPIVKNIENPIVKNTDTNLAEDIVNVDVKKLIKSLENNISKNLNKKLNEVNNRIIDKIQDTNNAIDEVIDMNDLISNNASQNGIIDTDKKTLKVI